MKVDLEKIRLGHSPLTDSVFAGIPNKAGGKWLKKQDVSNDFIECVLSRWEGQKETISSRDGRWEITVKKIK